MGVPIHCPFSVKRSSSVENCSIRSRDTEQLTKDRWRLMADVFTRWHLNQLRHFFCLFQNYANFFQSKELQISKNRERQRDGAYNFMTNCLLSFILMSLNSTRRFSSMARKIYREKGVQSTPKKVPCELCPNSCCVPFFPFYDLRDSDQLFVDLFLELKNIV